MVLDFVTSRGMMVVGGLLLAASAAGMYSVFTAVPEKVNFERFARDWTAPIVDAYKGTGTLGAGGEGRRIEFTMVDTINIARQPYYHERPFQVLIYRDGILLEFKDETVRIDLPGAGRTHLWYATNAGTYDEEEQSMLDFAVGQPLLVDFTQDLLIQRGANSTGVQQIYIYQQYAQVAPQVCTRIDYVSERVEKDSKISCPEGAIIKMVDSRGFPYVGKFEFENDRTQLDAALLQLREKGLYVITGEPRPLGDPGVRRLYLYADDVAGAALRVDYQIIDLDRSADS